MTDYLDCYILANKLDLQFKIGGNLETYFTFAFQDKILRPVASTALNGKTGMTNGIWVDSAYRRHGIGTALVKARETKARELGLKVIFSHTHPDNVEARALFKKLGYKENIAVYKELL